MRQKEKRSKTNYNFRGKNSTNPISHDVEYHQATAPSSFILFGSEKAQRKAKRGWQREISTHFSFREPRARSTQAHH